MKQTNFGNKLDTYALYNEETDYLLDNSDLELLDDEVEDLFLHVAG
jgi:hypothetical protein